MVNARKYPIGIQTFSRLREDGCLYIDKTDLVWQIAHLSPYVFLSRPRRFGKSLLTTTLESYFLGRRELFEGLKMMDLETEWTEFPVLHLDLSTAKNQGTPDALRDTLSWLLQPLTKLYGKDESEFTPGKMLAGLIRRAYEQTGRQVVVLIDEYDAPLLDVLHDDSRLDAMREVMQEFYQPLKASEAMIRFCFITGITKFSQLSIFSTINNIKNISMMPQFSAICGITEAEVKRDFAEDIRLLGQQLGCTADEAFLQLKSQYDGYHFSEDSEDIYNPYSLLNAFVDGKLGDFWFDSGTPSYLIRQMRHYHTDITTMERMEVDATAFNVPTEGMTTALPLLYQTGYLTIKDYDREVDTYILAIPNREVRTGFAKGLMPTYIGINGSDVKVGFAAKFWRALKAHDLDAALRHMQAYMEELPYVEGFKAKLAEAATSEGFYEYTLYLIFSMLNVYVSTQVKCSHGRMDILVQMPDTIYVMELKTRGTAQEALQQIDDRHYALPFEADGRPVVKAGLLFDMQTRTLADWAIG